MGPKHSICVSAAMEKGDGDSQGEHERHVGEKDEGQHALNALPDPDAGLSEEERKKIVCRCSLARDARLMCII